MGFRLPSRCVLRRNRPRRRMLVLCAATSEEYNDVACAIDFERQKYVRQHTREVENLLTATVCTATQPMPVRAGARGRSWWSGKVKLELELRRQFRDGTFGVRLCVSPTVGLGPHIAARDFAVNAISRLQDGQRTIGFNGLVVYR